MFSNSESTSISIGFHLSWSNYFVSESHGFPKTRSYLRAHYEPHTGAIPDSNLYTLLNGLIHTSIAYLCCAPLGTTYHSFIP